MDLEKDIQLQFPDTVTENSYSPKAFLGVFFPIRSSDWLQIL